MPDAPDCAAARELLPEVAADIAAGDDRARALRHLSGCRECRRELAQLTEVVDDLLLLAPAHEPPAGFERSVLARLTPAAPPRRRLPSPLLWAASSVVVALLAAGAVWWRTADDRELAADVRHTLAVAHGHGLSAAPLRTTGGVETGTVFAYEGSPSWFYVTFGSPPLPGRYEVRLRTRDGRAVTLRPLVATAASAAWGSRIDVAISQIAALEFAQSNIPVMTARFE